MCRIEGCTRKAKYRRDPLCSAHYARLHRYGGLRSDVHIGGPRRRRAISARFWPKVSRSEGCWKWTGCRDGDGYGQLGSGGKRGHISAHRAAWLIINGPIPSGLWVLHHCDNPSCVRADPDPAISHLFLGDRPANMQDCAAKSRLVSQAHPERLSRGERHGRSVLTLIQAQQLVARYAAGETNKSALAREFGVAHHTVRSVLSGATWAEALREANVAATVELISTGLGPRNWTCF